MHNYYMGKNVEESYRQAREVYAAFGVDTDEVLRKIKSIRISVHCWQGDDVTGLETGMSGLTGGILATGNYFGKARNGEELRQDIEKALSLIPGKHRVNIHAMYAETGGRLIDRDELSVEHFAGWIDWAKANNIGIDFNPTFFSHKMASTGFTLSSKDKEIRSFWIRHAKRCREIACEIGKALKTPCVNNIWIPDGFKDLPADRIGYRRILKESLDEILEQKYDKSFMIDAVESKLFGIGSESFVVGSHEFYMGYAMTRNVMLCLDAGHFHPTESIADKISSVLAFSNGLLLHISRGVRWDSDHVPIINDELLAIAQEVKRCGAFDRVHFALDFFDASINRIAAWVIGARAALKAILVALLEPTDLLADEEKRGDFGSRLALSEEFKTLPFGAVWNKYCQDMNNPVGSEWLNHVMEYEKKVLAKRI